MYLADAIQNRGIVINKFIFLRDSFLFERITPFFITIHIASGECFSEMR